jgi:transposase
MDQRSWTESHVAAFEFFGGVPARLVPEYVPRNIFRLLCPNALCGRQRWDRGMAVVSGPVAVIGGA